MSIRVEFVPGSTKHGEWSGAYAYRPDNHTDFFEKGELYLVMRIATDNSSFGVENFAKIILDELQRSYYDHAERHSKSTTAVIEDSVWKMKSKIELVLSREENLQGIDFEMGMAVLVDGALYALTVGETNIAVLRDGELVLISELLDDTSNSGFFKIGSLEMQESDKLALYTSKSQEGIADLTKTIDELDIASVDDLQEFSGASFMLIADDSLEWAEFVEVEEEIEEEGAETLNIAPLEEVTAEEDTDLATELLSKQQVKNEENVIEIQLDELGESAAAKDSNSPIDRIKLVGANFIVKASALFAVFQTNMRIMSFSMYGNIESLLSKLPISTNKKLKDVTREAPIQVITERAELSPEPVTEKNIVKEEEQQEEILAVKEEAVANEKVSELSIESQDEEFAASVIEQEEEEDVEADTFSEEATVAGALGPASRTTKDALQGERSKVTREALSRIQDTGSKLSKQLKGNETTYAKILSTIMSKLAMIANFLKDFFLREILGKQTRRFAYSEKRRVRRNRLIFAISLVVLSYFIYSNVQSAQLAREEELRVEEAQTAYDDLITRYNNLSTQIVQAQNSTDTQKGQVLGALDSLEQDISTQKFSSNLFSAELTQLESQIDISRDQVLGITPFTEPGVITDVGAQFPESILVDFEYAEGLLFITDYGRSVIYQVSTELNSQLEVYISAVTRPSYLTLDANGDIVFTDEDTSSALGSFNVSSNDSLQRFDSLPPAEIGKISEMSIYEGNNAIYELHQNHAQIFRRDNNGVSYAGGGAIPNFSSNPPNWKNAAQLADAIDIATPYEVYVLIENQGLHRYFGGGDNALTFDSFRNITQSDFALLSNATSIDVSLNYVVATVPSAKRIMLFRIDNNDPNKPLTLEKQFEYRGTGSFFTDMKEVKINEANRRIFILDGAKILRLDY